MNTRTLIRRAVQVTEGTLAQSVADNHDVFSGELARRWPEFVDCRRRAETMMPFLQSLLPDVRPSQIIDLGAGAGCEVIELSRLGHAVTANEINNDLRSRGIREGISSGAPLFWTSADWRRLSDTFLPESFDLVLLLGNSLCLVRDPKDHRVIAEQIASVCRRGGKLVVDQRNFGYILRDANTILGGTFRYSGQVVYCGRRIHGKPLQISSTNVRFGYFDTTTQRLVGAMDMYPFRPGELECLFHRVGFRKVGEFGDLGLHSTSEADFITLVFERT